MNPAPNNSRPQSPGGPLSLSSGQAQKFPFPPPPPPYLPVSQKITERFFRNPAKPADGRGRASVSDRGGAHSAALSLPLGPHHGQQAQFLRRMEVDSKGNKIIMTRHVYQPGGLGSLAGMGRMGWVRESPGALHAVLGT